MANLSFPNTVVPDTSVVLKWYVSEQETGRERALALRQAYLEGQVALLVPELLCYEVANVLRYKPGWDAAAVGQAVASLLALKIEIVTASETLLERAVDLACTHDITVYDAAFVALAQLRQADFLTADARLAHQLSMLPWVHLC